MFINPDKRGPFRCAHHCVQCLAPSPIYKRSAINICCVEKKKKAGPRRESCMCSWAPLLQKEWPRGGPCAHPAGQHLRNPEPHHNGGVPEVGHWWPTPAGGKGASYGFWAGAARRWASGPHTGWCAGPAGKQHCLGTEEEERTPADET